MYFNPVKGFCSIISNCTYWETCLDKGANLTQLPSVGKWTMNRESVPIVISYQLRKLLTQYCEIT